MHSKLPEEKWKNGIHCRLSCPSCSSDASLTLWLNGAQELLHFKHSSSRHGNDCLSRGNFNPRRVEFHRGRKRWFGEHGGCQAVGSNVFDIWLGLGLPWLCYLSWQTPNYLTVTTDELIPSTLILAGVLFVYLGTVAGVGSRCRRRLGGYTLLYRVLYAITSFVCGY